MQYLFLPLQFIGKAVSAALFGILLLIAFALTASMGSHEYMGFYRYDSVHDKFHRTLILSGFCLLKIAKISLNSSFFPKPIKR
ncbi:integral membrane protein [Acinetobacter baumannii]|nr:integral membrane protein [Acinetobacter baumannii]